MGGAPEFIQLIQFPHSRSHCANDDANRGIRKESSSVGSGLETSRIDQNTQQRLRAFELRGGELQLR